MHHPLKAALGGAALIITAALTLTGCSSANVTDAPSTSAKPHSTATAGPQLPGQSPGVTGAVDVPTKLKNTPAKRSDVRITSCKKVKDGWRAAGVGNNTSKKDASYKITVFFTDSRSTVVAWSETTLNVPAGKTGKWAAAPEFTAPTDTTCVLAAVS